MNMNQQQVTLLVMLDLSAAFDTVNHEILIKHLQSKIGLCGTPLEWFTSYLLDRSYRVTVNGKCLQRFHLNCGVPQGSSLGPMLFNIYMSGIFDIVQKRLPDVHCYADDSQLYLAFDPNCETSQDEAVKAMERCLLDIKMWAKSNCLKLNDDKTEFVIIGTRQQLANIRFIFLQRFV